MNKRDLLRKYGAWLVLIIAYLGFHFFQNRVWIEEHELALSDDYNIEKNASETQNTTSLPAGDTLLPTLQKDSSQPVAAGAGPSKPQTKRQDPREYIPPPQRKISLDINKAGKEEWEELRGIGDYRSDRIIRFREALGGFYAVDQVSETFGLPDSVFNEIRSSLYLSAPFRKIKINQLSYDSLHLHPYITKQMAYFIIRHRENKSVISNTDELYGIVGEHHQERLKKLEPYLDFSID